MVRTHKSSNQKPISTVSKEESGAAKRKKLKERAKEDERESKRVAGFFKPKWEVSDPNKSDLQTSTILQQTEEVTEPSTSASSQPGLVENAPIPTSSSNNEILTENQTESSNLVQATGKETNSFSTISDDEPPLSLNDPSKWPEILSDHEIKLLAQSRFQIGKNEILSTTGFNAKYFYGQKANGESYYRDWLRYSSTTNSAFCLPCCLFSKQNKHSPWSNYGQGKIGYIDFHNTLRGLTHENTKEHENNVRIWKSYIKSIENPKSIEFRATSTENVNHWREILKALIDAVMFLARNNLALTGKSHSINDSNNCGNFLNLVKLLSKYSAPLGKHVENLKKGSTSYLSPAIQNEFIGLCANEVRNKIIGDIKSRKYFSVILDSTPDISHQDQVAEIIRSVDCSSSGCVIKENFVGFLATSDKTGLGLFNLIAEKLKEDNLNIMDCRGQGYDNGSNMSGKFCGVQARMLEVNSKALFLPCAAHSLNLVGKNCAEKLLTPKLILGSIQNLYAFFAGSTSRWNILKSHVSVSLKCQSATRWSSKADAVRAVCSQFQGICEALSVISESDQFPSDATAAAISRLKEIQNFKFLLGSIIWNKILAQINLCNLALQDKNIDLSSAAKQLKILKLWLEKFKTNGFESCQTEAECLAKECNIEIGSGFENVRRGRGFNRKFMAEENYNDAIQQTNLERFKNEMFDSLLIKLIEEMNGRFQTMNDLSNLFGFLWGEGLDATSTLKSEVLNDKVTALCEKYPDDFDKDKFLTELQILKLTVTEFLDDGKKLSDLKAIDVLNIVYQNGLENVLWNCEIAIRIFLTMPVSVASAERAFSKLKLIKNYLRSTMSQDRLTGLAILSIEKFEAENVDFENIINKFISAKCRKIPVY